MKLITTIFIVFASIMTFAQSGTAFFFLQEDTTAAFYHGDDAITTIEHLYMMNDDSGPVDVDWTVDWNIPDGWGISLCDEDLCYPLSGNNTASGGPSTIPGNGYKYDWHLQVQHNEQPGNGSAVLTVKSSIDIFYTQQITVNFEVTDVVNVEDNFSNVAYVYPNPANEIIKMSIAQNTDLSKVILTDINGKTIKSKVINNNENLLELDINNLPIGNYNFTVVKKNGEIFSSQVVSIQ